MKKIFFLAISLFAFVIQSECQSPSVELCCKNCKVSGLFRYLENEEEQCIVKAYIHITGGDHKVSVRIPELGIRMKKEIVDIVTVDNADCNGIIMWFEEGCYMFLGNCEGYPTTYFVFQEDCKILSTCDDFKVKNMAK